MSGPSPPRGRPPQGKAPAYPGGSALLVLAALLIPPHFSGCSAVLSREAMALAAPDVSLAAVAENPQPFVGRAILLAGPILHSENLREGTLLEILAYPPTRHGNPDYSEPAVGRFLLLYPDYLDTLIYHPGRDIAAVGPIAGQRRAQLGEHSRMLPVVHPVELRLIEPPRFYPPFHFGFGIQFGF